MHTNDFLERGDDSFFMKQALLEAKIAFQKDEIPVGCIIVSKDYKIISRSHNLCESLQDPTAHAEMQAITSACHHLGTKYLTECTMYVTLEPCNMCAGALFLSRIGRLVYSASDTKRGFSSDQKNKLHKKSIIEKGLMSEVSSEILQLFFGSHVRL